MATRYRIQDRKKNGMVKGRLIPNGNDADWSDEDGVKSGSATGISEGENDDLNREKQKAIIMAKSLNGRKFDPGNMILDKIDAELSFLNRSQSQSSSTTGSTVLHKPGSRSKGSDGSRSGGSHKSMSSKDGTDTGLGTASIHDNLSEGGDLPRINGTAEIYSDVGAGTTDHYSDDDGKKTGAPSDLDSVTAQQVDAKFKAILRKKKASRMKGGYLDNLKASDTETIRTEDYENIFKDALVYQSDSDTLENKSDEDSDNVSGKLTNSDADTPTKADLSWDYYDTDQSKASKSAEEGEGVSDPPRSPSGTSQNRPHSPSRISQSTHPYPSEHQTIETSSSVHRPGEHISQAEDKLPTQPRGKGRSTSSFPTHGARSSPRRQAGPFRRKFGYISDADSVRTEDFEVKFQELIFRPSADSETDHTDNDPLHAKVKEILKVTAPYRQKKDKKPQNGHVKIDESPLHKSTPKRSPIKSSTSVDDVRREIDRESSRIQQEIERERRSNLPVSRKDSKSPTRTVLDLSSSMDKPAFSELNHNQSGGHNSLKDIPSPMGRSSPTLQDYEDSGYKTPPRARSPTLRARDRISGMPPMHPRSVTSSRDESQRTVSSSREEPFRSSSPNPRSRTSLSDSLRPGSPRPDSSFPDPKRSVSPILRSGSSSFQEQDPSSSFSSLRAENEEEAHTLSPQLVMPAASKYQDLSVLRARSLSPNANDRHRPASPLQGVLKDSTSSFLTGPRPASPRPGMDHSMRSELSVSFQDQLPVSSQRSKARSQSVEGRLVSDLQGDNTSPRFNHRRRNSYDPGVDSAEEMENSRSTWKASRAEVQIAEKKLKAVNAQTEDARTQLMLTEFKRENLLKDYERMSEDLQRTKKEMKDIEDQERSRIGDRRRPDMTDDKTRDLVKENDSLKLRLRQMDGLELERDELVRQLELAKEDLFNEQRKARKEKEDLKEEIETMNMKLEERHDGDDVALRLHKMDAAYRRMEKEKNEIIHEKTKLYEDLRDRSKVHMAETKRNTSRESGEMREEIDDLCRNVNLHQEAIKERDNIIANLSERSTDVQQRLSKEVAAKEGMMEDHKRTLQSLRKEMDSAMVQLRENMFLDKQQALETLRRELEQEHRETASRADDKHSQHLTEHMNLIKAKEDEISRLIDLVKKLEGERRVTERTLREEAREEVRIQVDREAQSLQADHRLQMSREREQIEKETKVTLRKLTNELDEERRQREHCMDKIAHLSKDLEEGKQQNKQAMHDKMVAVSKAKENVRNELQTDFDKVKEKMTQDYQREIDKLTETVRQQEEELRKLKTERIQWIHHDRQNSTVLDRMERTVVNEVNEECRRTANVLGVGPRKVNLANFQGDSQVRTPTTSALVQQEGWYNNGYTEANLRACNEELRNLVQELKQELTRQKSSVMRTERDKDEMVQKIKEQLEKEKNMELERLKAKLAKGSQNELRETFIHNIPNNDLAANMQYSKPPKVPQYEFKPRSDHQQQEVDRLEREIKRLAMQQKRLLGQTPPNHLSNDDINASKMIQHLQMQVTQLNAENNSLRGERLASCSVPDLSNPAYYQQPGGRIMGRSPSPTPHQERMINLLAHRTKAAEFESDMATEQQERSRNMMSQKMGDMTKLQNTLTNQAKDLIQLSRAYSNLNNTYPAR
ncbi:myosin-3-like isoform X3 [Mizuhopecten yessoensis]|uniref:myosin-3-like isoform X3 n=1 Tax=Mizuhopecten yessoensis TaxID=6573 RepID=UPI000B45CA4F|nr:myosin-3-like isoform X3 [Mizuhopecten yessoensis]